MHMIVWSSANPVGQEMFPFPAYHGGRINILQLLSSRAGP